MESSRSWKENLEDINKFCHSKIKREFMFLLKVGTDDGQAALT